MNSWESCRVNIYEVGVGVWRVYGCAFALLFSVLNAKQTQGLDRAGFRQVARLADTQTPIRCETFRACLSERDQLRLATTEYAKSLPLPMNTVSKGRFTHTPCLPACLSPQPEVRRHTLRLSLNIPTISNRTKKQMPKHIFECSVFVWGHREMEIERKREKERGLLPKRQWRSGGSERVVGERGWWVTGV